ncbi:hypothetical protein XacyCFBP1159_20135 [Xanthomonas arboricola pv. corylina]|nr:hypothetical protein XacyCFBP2565_05645 [Xanthomonas arboricola pv. corylina]PPU56325.1 hypothetical protein XacyCFBP1159_20135 [Xanthomonas arboricola pv. corylina]
MERLTSRRRTYAAWMPRKRLQGRTCSVCRDFRRPRALKPGSRSAGVTEFCSPLYKLPAVRRPSHLLQTNALLLSQQPSFEQYARARVPCTRISGVASDSSLTQAI